MDTLRVQLLLGREWTLERDHSSAPVAPFVGTRGVREGMIVDGHARKQRGEQTPSTISHKGSVIIVIVKFYAHQSCRYNAHSTAGYKKNVE